MDKKNLKIFAILATVLCIIGGIFVILGATINPLDDKFMWIGIGIYFIGKGLFVGPMILSNIK